MKNDVSVHVVEGSEAQPERERSPDDPHGLVEPGQFAEDLRELARDLSVPRANLKSLRSRLVLLALSAGANPLDVPFWEGEAAEYQNNATSIGFVPRATPSSVLGIEMLRVWNEMLQPRTRDVAALHLAAIAREIATSETQEKVSR